MNHLWQSTVFALAARLLALAFRGNRAQVRYWIWFGASVKFLVPFALLMSVGKLVPARSARPIAPAALAVVAQEIAAPFEDTAVGAPLQRHSIDWLPIVWACGFAAVVVVRFRDWLRIRAAVRASVPIELAAGVAVHTSPGLLEPGVAGFWRPVLLLPADIFDRLTVSQLEAVLAHELCHVRRRDNLLAAVHMVVEALFWFHPLVWWIGARLVEERERACDEEVLRRGSAPYEYAEAILNVCKFYVESPLACVSGVTGADLKKRIEAILRNRGARELTRARKAALAAAAMAILAIPVAIGVLTAPVIRAQAPQERPKFEVASVKPCRVDGQNGSRFLTSPGRLNISCETVEELIRTAYIRWASGVFVVRDPSSPPLSGGPDWTRSERYIVDAIAEGSQSQGVMMGPMLQTLLEDRFKLKIHRESREVPVYALTLAKDESKLKPFQKGSCTAIEFGMVPRPRPADMCHVMVGRGTLTAQGSTLTALSKLLFLILDRPVVDRTGVSGLFDFQLEFALDERTPYISPDGQPAFPSSSADEPGPSIFDALQRQYGLKLEPAKGSRDYLVIDHVERPSEN